jgi:hypothetical protein
MCCSAGALSVSAFVTHAVFPIYIYNMCMYVNIVRQGALSVSAFVTHAVFPTGWDRFLKAKSGACLVYCMCVYVRGGGEGVGGIERGRERKIKREIYPPGNGPVPKG